MNIDEEKEIKRIKKAASMMGKLSSIKSPKTNEDFSRMGKLGAIKRWGNKQTS